jgi:NAD-dependent dihydropyrimidine dehydrogenase PreA subunit
MAGRKLTVVISQAPGKNPVKRNLEEEIATRLMLSGTAEVSVVPHLYDLSADHTGMLWLKSLKGNLVVLGWLYPRAIRWILDRNGVKGLEGESRLNVAESEDEQEDEDAASEEEATAPRGIGAMNVPNRLIYTIDLRDHPSADTYVTEIERIADLTSTPLVQLGGLGLNGSSLLPVLPSSPPSNGATSTNGFHGTNGTNGKEHADHADRSASSPTTASPFASIGSLLGVTSPNEVANQPMIIPGDDVRRRWYPVIDYSRCTNCMECIDFCLFGVYGVDNADRILVEQQDNCKKGCPACSRVCPVNAIFFPEHKTPAIAGAEGGGAADFKIDLSKLFGAPSPLDMAIMERDTELVADGRDAVGATVGIPKRQCGQPAKPRDALDDLMDGLDSLDV